MEDIDNIEEDEYGFSKNYFLAKELGGSSKKSAHKLSDINIIDEQELRETAFNIETKHEKEIFELLDDYKTMLQEIFELLVTPVILPSHLEVRLQCSIRVTMPLCVVISFLLIPGVALGF
ncbi:unnamed protein product [Eruca vesicaria subsp. sativa]|uniref:Uncharacterized protein n=1 Tax=Eruca vesicaria subsp. sativa TaxID=29727 RepID=A0ABC8J9K3_ERUVS|nr:unnamed protein product [Eruca vesicaria subsp. sativa]